MTVAARPYAAFWSGKPVMARYTTTSGYKAGDVIVVGGLPCVAHEDKPAFTGDTLLDSLAVGGGIYKMVADAAYPPGTSVYWDDTNKKATTTATANKHFGWLLAGADGDMAGAGSTGDLTACYVYHDP